jgi:serine/threonine-protein kinase
MAESVVVHVEPASIEMTPGGGPVTLSVRVINATSIVDRFTISVVGGDDWLLAPEVEVRLLPGAETTASVRLSIPADRFVTAGPRVLGVRVLSDADSRIQQTVDLPAVVREVPGGLGIRLDPQVVTASGAAHVLVRVRNPGNAPVELDLSAEESKGLSSFAFQPERLTVPPRHEVAAAVTIATKRPMLGADETRSFTLHADGAKVSLSATGTLTVSPRISRRVLRLGKWLLAALILLAIAAIAFLTTGDRVSVPKVTGKSEADARRSLEGAGFVVAVTEQADDSVPEGVVIDQTPAAGQKAKKGSVVDITVSAGPVEVKVPNLIGLSQTDAVITLQNLGLRASPGQQQYSDEPPGTVIDQDPRPGQMAPRDSAVTLIVSRGAEEVSLPGVVGMTVGQAESALRTAGLEVEMTEAFSPDIAAGVVMEQTPPAGATATKGSVVSIVVSAGPEPFVMPYVIGMSETNAVMLLEDLGLVVTVNYEVNTTTTNVVGQTPEGGDTVRRGDDVTITVGRFEFHILEPIPLPSS